MNKISFKELKIDSRPTISSEYLFKEIKNAEQRLSDAVCTTEEIEFLTTTITSAKEALLIKGYKL